MDIRRRSFLSMLAAGPTFAFLGPSLAAEQVSYWHHMTSQAEFAALQKVVDLFEESGAGVSIDAENIPNPSYMAKVSAAAIGGGLPDTAMVLDFRFNDLMGMGVLADISEKVRNWEGREDIPSAAWQPFTRGEAVFGVPALAFVDWMYYRKDLFEAAGIDGAPRTFDEMALAARKVSDPDKGRYGFAMRGGAGGGKWVIDVIQAYGSPIVVDGAVAIDRKAAVEAVAFYAGLVRDKVTPPTAAADGYTQTMDSFRRGSSAMLWHHTGSLKEISDSLKPAEQFATAPIPSGPQARIARISYGANSEIRKSSDAAWKWISFWGGKEAALVLLEQAGYFPASRSALADSRVTGNPLYRPAVETMGFGTPVLNFRGVGGWSQNTVEPAFQSVIVGHATPEEAVENIIRGLEAAIR